MSTIADLKELREKMIERLTQIPEYQALKAMDRFIGEVTNLYDIASKQQDASADKLTPPATENKVKSEAATNSAPRVTPYIPANRVA
jgi:hypothetical protein